MRSMFSSCNSLTSLDLSNFNSQNLTDISSMFRYFSKLTYLNISNFNTKNIINMERMFDDVFLIKNMDLGKLKK